MTEFDQAMEATHKASELFLRSEAGGRRRTSAAVRSTRIRRKLAAVKTVTCAPHDDGRQWRKYGQKKIRKTNLQRSYYRCSHNDKGCRATKQVEPKEGESPFLFVVTYSGEHTCSEASEDPLMAAPQVVVDDCGPPAAGGAFFLTYQSADLRSPPTSPDGFEADKQPKIGGEGGLRGSSFFAAGPQSPPPSSSSASSSAASSSEGLEDIAVSPDRQGVMEVMNMFEEDMEWACELHGLLEGFFSL